MTQKELVFAVVLIITGAAGFFYSLSLPSHGTLALSPGLFPGVVSLLLFLLSLAYLIQILRKPAHDKNRDKQKPDADRNLFLTLSLFPFYLIMLYYFHFMMATFIFLITAMIFMYRRFRWQIPLISAISVMVVYYLFEFLLKVRLP